MGILYKISIDTLNEKLISGWCFKRLNKQTPVSLHIMQGTTIIATTKAEVFREDLKALGVHPTGCCGFEAYIDTLDSSLNADSELILRDGDSQREIARITQEGLLLQNSVRDKLARVFKHLDPNRKTKTLFMHIPKTAGTSFNTDMRAQLGAGSVVSHIEEIAATKYSQLAEHYHFISGHLILGKLKEHFDLSQFQLYTIIREPYEHLHSHLKWMKNHYLMGRKKNRDKINPALFGASNTIASLDFSDPSAIKDFSTTISGVEARLFDNLQTRHFLDHHVEKVTETDLHCAVENFHYFYAIGLTEEYDLFLHQFGNKKRVKVRNRQVLNRSVAEDLYDCHDPLYQEALFPLIRYDLELYQRIKDSKVGVDYLE